MRKLWSGRHPLRRNRKALLKALRVTGALIVLLSEIACHLFYAQLPPGTQSFTPPAVYKRWWSLVEECSGRSFDMREVRWYHVSGRSFTIKGMAAGGFYTNGSHRLVLADSLIQSGESVRHEMLHAMLQKTGHPRSEFLGDCAGLVVCQGVCIKDAGRWRPPPGGFVVLPPDSFEISSHAKLLPREVDGDRWMTLWVSVRNPRNRAAGVRVPPPADPITPPTFVFNVRGFPGRGVSGGEVATDSSSLVFGPQETKRFLFEWRVGVTLNTEEIAPGRYLVQGGYVHSYAPFDTVMIER